MIYLTPSGRDASEYSTGPNKITCYPLSYDKYDNKPNILSWLDACLNKSKGCPRIHEVIKQYITFIKNTRQIMQNELLNLLLSEENVDVTLGILRDGQKIKEKIRRDFCNQLVKLAGEYGLELREQKEYDDNIVTWNSDYGWMIFVGKKRHQSQVGFVIGNFSRKNEDYGGMLYGLSIINGYFSNLGELKNVFKIKSSDPNDQPLFDSEKEYHKLPENKGNFKREFPFGYSFLYDEDRAKVKRWFDWDDLQTLADMHNGKMLDFMRSRFEILKKYGIIDKL